MTEQERQEIAVALREAARRNKSGTTRLKIRTLLRKFGLKRRTVENAAQITDVLKQAGIEIEPPITKEGVSWPARFNDRVVLNCSSAPKVKTSSLSCVKLVNRLLPMQEYCTKHWCS